MNVETSKAGLRSNLNAFSHSRAHSYSNNSHNLSTTSTAKQNTSQRYGWWDYAPVYENRKRPVQWASPSLIITAHATEPFIVCLHFPSNKTSTLPSPPSIQGSPLLYEPPSIIAVSARAEWVFAFFPGINKEGVGCLWNRGNLLDEWKVRDWHTFARGDSVVTAHWLNSEREWATSDVGSPQRLPLLGPYIPLADPALLVVTEMHLCNVYHIQPPSDQVKVLSSTLSRRSINKGERDKQNGERVDGAEGLGRCLHATIGFAYDDASFLIATYSSFVSPVSPDSSSEPEELNMSLGISDSNGPSPENSDWQTWREENMLDICEASMTFRDNCLQMSINPLTSIHSLCPSTSILTNLTFIPFLPLAQGGMPSTPTQVHRMTPQSSPAAVPAHIQSPGRLGVRPPMKTNPSKPAVDKSKGSLVFLICTALDLCRYTSGPKSDLMSYAFARSHTEQVQSWQMRRVSHHSVPKGVITHVSPFRSLVMPQHIGILMAVLNTEGQILQRKDGHYNSVGMLQVLKLPELTVDVTCEATNIVCPVRPSGIELPFSMAVSPNRSLICSVSQSDLGVDASAFIHSYPTRTVGREAKQSSALLQLSFQKRAAMSDVIHLLSVRETHLSVLEDVISSVLAEIETQNNGLIRPLTNDLLGTAIEIYRAKSDCLKLADEKSRLDSRCRVALEICSLAACNSLWDEISENELYTPDSAWSLLSFCAYYIDLMDKLLKDLLSFYDSTHIIENTTNAMDVSDAASPRLVRKHENDISIASIEDLIRQGELDVSLIHMLHPYAFENLHLFLQHMKQFQETLGSKAKSDEQYLLTLETLVDISRSTALDLSTLDKVFQELGPEINDNAERAPDLARRCLAALQPPAQYVPFVRKIAEKIAKSGAVDKSRLFVVADDFVDGMLGLSIADSDKAPSRDVISKIALDNLSDSAVCARCGSKSEVVRDTTQGAPSRSSVHWSAWERNWKSHCVCGGPWSGRL